MEFDPSREAQMTEDQLKWGYWWVSHKVQIKKSGTVALAIAAFSLVGYAAYGFIDWFFLSGVAERNAAAQLTVNLTDYAYFREKNAPKQLSVGSAVSLASGAESQDVFARLANANLAWWAEFDYRFSVPGASTQSKRGYILPGETRYLHDLGVKAPRTGPATFEMSNLQWHRVDNHVITPNYETWAKARLNFQIASPRFAPAAPADPLKVSKALFTVKNASAFSYWNVGFFVAAMSGTSVAGVNMVTISELRAGESREVEAGWFNELPFVDKVEVRPVVNIFDEKVYISPGR